MPRQQRGTIIETRTDAGTTYSGRFMAGGKRRCQVLGGGKGYARPDADRDLAYIVEQVARGDWQPAAVAPPVEPADVPTFRVFASEWFGRRVKLGGKGRRAGKGLTTRGEADLRWRIEHHLLGTFGDLRLDEITPRVVDQWTADKVGEINATSINKCLATLKAIMEQAYDYEHIDRVPKIVTMPGHTPDRTLITCTAHMTALLQAADMVDTERSRGGERRAMIAVMMLAGLRLGEALELRRGDVDLAEGIIRVRAEAEDAAKSDAARRRVLVLPVLRDELGRWLAMNRLGPDGLLFATASGNKWSESNVNHRVVCRAVGAANERLVAAGQRPMPRLTPKSLRATFASLLYTLGEPKPSILEQMGHSSEDVTLRHYAKAWEPGDGNRLRAFVHGASWQVLASSADQAPARSPQAGPAMGAWMTGNPVGIGRTGTVVSLPPE